MKRSCLILALVLTACLVSGAMAQTAPVTKEGVITLEGEQETVTLTLYESPRGYKLWYDAAMFAPAAPDEGSDIDAFVPTNPDAIPGVGFYVNYSAQLDYTLEMARDDLRKSLVDNGYDVSDMDTLPILPQYKAYGFHAVKGENALERYVVAAQTGEFYLSVEYPLEASEGYGARLYLMVSSFEPTVAAAQ